MSYAERRKGKLTGRWIGEVDTKQGGLELRMRRRFETKKEADGYEAYVKATGQEPAGIAKGSPAGSFSAWTDRFLERNPDWARKDRSALQRLEWVRGQIGAIDVKQVTTSELDRLVTKLRKTGASNRTINRYLDAASKTLRFAHERDAIPGMPHVPRLADKGKDRTKVLSLDLENAICRWIEDHRDPRIAFAVRVLVSVGFRAGELDKLRPDQVENESVTLGREQTKTDKARTVYIEPEMAKKLRAMLAAGTMPKACQVYKVFKQAVKACGGDEELTVHSLRHTCATRLIEDGNDALVVAGILGHSSIQTTKRYTHPDFEVIKNAMKKVPQRVGETDQKGDVLPFALDRKAV